MLTQEKINVKLIELNMNRELSSNNMTLTNDIIKLHLLWGTRLTNVIVTFQTIKLLLADLIWVQVKL